MEAGTACLGGSSLPSQSKDIHRDSQLPKFMNGNVYFIVLSHTGKRHSRIHFGIFVKSVVAMESFHSLCLHVVIRPFALYVETKRISFKNSSFIGVASHSVEQGS